MNIYLSISQAVIAVLSADIALYAAVSSARSARAAERSAARQREAYDLAALRELILSEYLEREFKATEAPVIDGREVNILRDAKTEAMRQYEQDTRQWDQASDLSNQGAWQNRVAFETAWVLEHLGIAAFTGMVPLRVLLGLVGDAVIDDWLLCRSWVKSYRESQHAISQIGTSDTPNAHYHRRHAEWLALVATIWMSQHWSYPNCDRLARWYGGIQNLSAVVRSLSHADGALIPDVVREDVRLLTGVDM